MKIQIQLAAAFLISPFLMSPVFGQGGAETDAPVAPVAFESAAVSKIQIAQLVPGNVMRRNYPDALPTLLHTMAQETAMPVERDPIFVSGFDDPQLQSIPLLYLNYADREDWTLSDSEKQGLKQWLERGGFIFFDAGITAEFLREKQEGAGQFHSFAEWEVTPDVAAMFEEVFPNERFKPLPRSHGIFRALHVGLPDAAILPDTVRDYVVDEKWPQGTYSMVGLRVNGRLAVVATPILAMGWGKNELGQWSSFIGFRVREGAEGLSDRLAQAAYSGVRFEVTREDGLKDIVYTQQQAMPAWVQEPGDRWRVFRYYYTQEISDYAHTFYTRLGMNVFMYALTQVD